MPSVCDSGVNFWFAGFEKGIEHRSPDREADTLTTTTILHWYLVSGYSSLEHI